MDDKATLRPICTIAMDIRRDWKKPYFGAVPYLNAMLDLRTMQDTYGQDDARDIVLRFLSNASSYRGEVARKAKAELKAHLGVK